MASENNYEKLLEPWEQRLISARARRFGFRWDELEDLEQKIVPSLVSASFQDDGRSKRVTFLINIIDRQLRRVRRDRRRDIRRVNYEARSLEGMSEARLGSADGIDRLCMRLDVDSALSRLSAEDRFICISLRRGESEADIARLLCISAQSMSEKMRNLAERLRRKLAAYCGNHRFSP